MAAHYYYKTSIRLYDLGKFYVFNRLNAGVMKIGDISMWKIKA